MKNKHGYGISVTLSIFSNNRQYWLHAMTSIYKTYKSLLSQWVRSSFAKTKRLRPSPSYDQIWPDDETWPRPTSSQPEGNWQLEHVWFQLMHHNDIIFTTVTEAHTCMLYRQFTKHCDNDVIVIIAYLTVWHTNPDSEWVGLWYSSPTKSLAEMICFSLLLWRLICLFE